MIWVSNNNSMDVCSQYKNVVFTAIEFINGNDMKTISNGRHDIDTNLYVNILEYETKSADDCIWEAHRCYLDLHYIISGCEQIQIAETDNLNYLGYEEETDYVKLEGKFETSVLMNGKGLLLLYPEDAHRTGVMTDQSSSVKKAVFKIKTI